SFSCVISVRPRAVAYRNPAFTSWHRDARILSRTSGVREAGPHWERQSMRYAVLALVVLATTTVAAPVPADKWAEKMFGKSSSHDFGTVPRGAQLHHQFPLTNIYAVPLQVISTRTSCGCVTVTPPTGAINPRESGIVDVTMDTHRFTGP